MCSMDKDKATMTLMEVCAELDIVPNTAYAWINKGILRPLPYDPAKQRKRYKFDRAEIMARKSQPAERLAQPRTEG